MRKTRWILILVLLALLGGAWWYFRGGKQADTGTASTSTGDHRSQSGNSPHASGQPPVPVVIGTVQRRDVPIYLDGIGTVQAFNTVTVRARIDGQVKQIAFKEGQDVKQGDLLAVIDPAPYQAAYDQAVAKKGQDNAQLANARQVFQRNSELLAKNVLDHQTYDTSKFQVDQFVALVQTDDANIEAAKVNLDYTRITAPISGRVGLRLVDEGNIVHASDTNGIVVITQLKPISVLFTLPQQDLSKINEAAGQNTLKVFAYDRDNTKPISEGTLAVVNNQIDTTTGTIQLKATFANDDGKLWPGQFVNSRLLVTTQTGALVVPASVVQRGPQGSFAYVVNSNNVAEMRPVTVGQIDAGIAIVESGLQEGEQVVVDGQYKLQPGVKVQASAPPNSRISAEPRGNNSNNHRQSSTASQPTPSPAGAG
jgi:membrane fusion protein, multidrug efflux system